MCLPVEKKTTLELEHNEATYKDSKALHGSVVSGCSPHHRDIMSAQGAPSAAEIVTIVSTRCVRRLRRAITRTTNLTCTSPSFTLNYIEFPVISAPCHIHKFANAVLTSLSIASLPRLRIPNHPRPRDQAILETWLHGRISTIPLRAVLDAHLL